MILNPFDARSLKWDLFAELQNPYDVEQLASALIPDSGGEHQIWSRYGQTFLSAQIRQAQASGVNSSAELYRLLTIASVEELRLLLEGTAAQPLLEKGNEKMLGSVRSVTTLALASLPYINQQTTALFSIRQWIRKSRGVLFLRYQADQIPALRSVIATWMRVALIETLTLPEADARLWFVVDELDALGAIHGLADALSRIRKFGGRMVIGFQSIAQVSGTYGDKLAKTIVENCGTTLILRCSSSEHGGTAEFASQLIGMSEVERTEHSTSRSNGGWFTSRPGQTTQTTSQRRIVEPAVMPSEIERLPDLSGYLKRALQPDWTRVGPGTGEPTG